MQHYDAIVIGAGNGGLAPRRLSPRAAKRSLCLKKTVLREALPRPSGAVGSILRYLCTSCAASARMKNAPAA